jgi:hypothetical protein
MAVIQGVNIAGMDDTSRVRMSARRAADEMFALMKEPSQDLDAV